MAPSRFSELSQVIAQNMEVVEKYHKQHNLPLPSFEVGSPVDTTIHDDPVAERARITAIEASIEVRDLLEGSTMQIRPDLNATSFQVFYRYDIPSKVPADGEISYENLAKQCNLEVQALRRLIRFAIVHYRIFHEKREGYVSHSAASKLLADSPDAMASIWLFFDQIYPCYSHTAEALQKYPQQTATQSGFTLAHQTDHAIFHLNHTQPNRAALFSGAMRHITNGYGHDTLSLTQSYPWSTLATPTNPNPLIVDLGGGSGHTSALLATLHPPLYFQVQDLPDVIAAATSSQSAATNNINPTIQSRITFLAHDFKTPQPTTADVYLIRQILHDWPDHECVTILRSLIPVLKPGARIVVNDCLVSPPGVNSPYAERHITAIDLSMLSVLGGKERDRKDWEDLFHAADPRFTNVTCAQAEGSCLAIIEATWSG